MKKNLQKMTGKLLGKWGEDEAGSFLKKKGYHLLARNRHTKSGEIDIIASESDCLVFVEVKTRSSEDFCSAGFSVGIKKQKKLCRCAREYIQEENIVDRQCRFDVIIINTSGNNKSIELIKNAFGEECCETGGGF